MNIHRLLVYSPDHRITIFSGEAPVDLTGRLPQLPNGQETARDYFNAGYILGLVLELSTIHSTALGLAVSGTYLRNEVSPDVKMLLKYINDWINDMDQPAVGA